MTENVTKKHFKIFKRACRKWLKKLGLADWLVYYSMSFEIEHYAEICTSRTERATTIYLCGRWPLAEIHPLNEKNLEASAKHEILHLLVADLADLARDRYSTEEEIDCAEESLVERLMKIV